MTTLARRVALRFKLAERAISHGPFKLHVEDGLPESDVEATLKALDRASQLIQRRFGRDVLYGEVHIVRKVSMGETFYAQYAYNRDVVSLSTEAEGDGKSVHALIHEFGHRYENKKLTRAQKDEFRRIILGGAVFHTFTYAERKEIAEEYRRSLTDDSYFGNELFELWSNAHDRPNDGRVGPLAARFFDGETDVLDELVEEFAALRGSGEIALQVGRREPTQVSSYAGKDWHENFAEAFAYEAQGKALPEAVAAFMAKL